MIAFRCDTSSKAFLITSIKFSSSFIRILTNLPGGALGGIFAFEVDGDSYKVRENVSAVMSPSSTIFLQLRKAKESFGTQKVFCLFIHWES